MSNTPICDAVVWRASRPVSDGFALDRVIPAETGEQLERDRAELVDVVNAFVDETVDYMTLNKLGNPEDQHNVKRARALLARIEGEK